ncbi:MAG: glycoside hydrolase family 31 protein, partial [Anaerolineae bacterium]|nr:glycoside hydrolase family 31 protein [Anaerolineae bacterium]
MENDILDWQPGMPDTGNLFGTRRTLDECHGDARLEKGLLSSKGWVLFDDSKNVVFDSEGWVGPRPDNPLHDWYFLGYGHNYKQTLSDYVIFGGKTSLIPRFVLGSWWSRYWAYSENDLRALVAEFEEHDIPLDVFVIDMDWHTPLGWTGYTWNRELFPDPPAFLAWLHTKGLKTTLNLHPADGVHPHEDIYPLFAEKMGVDPQDNQPIPFQIADKDYVKHYFEVIHHPLEDQGVDFWWMDWQQGEISEVKGLDPLLWINHLHFNDIKRHGVRPMLYSRWGGLGNHRYYIGFSGDTYVTWESLQFQPYMTSTASNVLYGWWSHDIGGHMGGATDPELYARWVQFGALSPILRLHSTKDPRAERRPWAYPDEVFQASKKAFHLRYQLIPYIYTMARAAVDDDLALCRPMYYEHPDLEAAYVSRYEYYFGDQLIAAPFVFPRDPQNGLAHTDVWIPPGEWFAYDTLESFHGPRWIRMFGSLQRIPLLAKCGAVIPLAAPFDTRDSPFIKSGTTAAIPRDYLQLMVFPGKGCFDVYEDDGVSEQYKDGADAWTHIATAQPRSHIWLVEISPVEGGFEGLPTRRGYTILFRGSEKPQSVTLNNEKIYTWEYFPEDLTTKVDVGYHEICDQINISLETQGEIIATGEHRNKDLITRDVKLILGTEEEFSQYDIHHMFETQSPARDQALTRIGAPFASIIAYAVPDEARTCLGHLIIAQPGTDHPYSADVTFILHKKGIKETQKLSIEKTSKSHILQVPFVCDTPTMLLWEANVDFEWQGKTWQMTYQSKPMFPSINMWHCLVCLKEQRKVVLEALLTSPHTAILDLSIWKIIKPELGTTENCQLPFVMNLNQLCADVLPVSEKNSSLFLVSRVTNPCERSAIFAFTSTTKVSMWINGKIVVEQDKVDDTALG